MDDLTEVLCIAFSSSNDVIYWLLVYELLSMNTIQGLYIGPLEHSRRKL